VAEDLVQWLRTQLDEDERTARATLWDGSGNKLSWELMASATIDVGGDEFYVGDRTIANQMMAWDPARVLREIDAKRGVITRLQHLLHDDNPFVAEQADASLRLLALPYADRPGYNDHWRP
jgi:hypothetical protein